MTFSEFLKALEVFYGRFARPYFKKNESSSAGVADFVREVFLSATLDKDEPFNDASLPQRLFSGNSRISKRLAKTVLSNLSKDDFSEFLSQLDSEDSLASLAHNFCITYSNADELFIAIFEIFKAHLTDAADAKTQPDAIGMDASDELSSSLSNIPTSDKRMVSVETFFGSHVPAKEFINREAPRQVFYDTIGGKLEPKIIMYYGIGGIGKSSLINNLKEYAESKELLYSSVDFDDPALRTPYRALLELEKNLKISLPHFDVAVTICYLKRNPDSLAGDIGLPSAVSKEVLRLYKTSMSIGALGLTGLVDRLYTAVAFQRILVPEIKTLLGSMEDAGANDIEEILPTFFAYDLTNYLALNNRLKCVMFFDTYELLWHNKFGETKRFSYDQWIRKLAEKLGDVIFVISGREKIDWQTVDAAFWDSQVSFVPLDLLSPDFAFKYLDICKIFETDIRTNIVSASQGHPYYLDLCVDTYYKLKNTNRPIIPELFGKGYSEIQECFFRSLKVEEIDTLKVLSIPRFYDLEIFKHLVSEYQTSYALISIGDFNSLSFIKRDVNGKFYIHVLMRKEIAKHIDRDLKNDINSKMVAFYDDKLSRDVLPIEDIKYFFAELVYHLKRTVPTEAFLQKIENNYISVIKRLQLSGETRYVLEEFREIFDETYMKLSGTEFFAVMVDMIHLSGEYKRAVEIIDNYLASFTIDQIASDKYTLSLYIRKVHHRMFYAPINELEHDLKLVADKVNKTLNAPLYGEILFMLGAHIYLPLGDLEKSASHLASVNELAQRNNLTGLLCRGLRKFSELMCSKGKYQQAESICRKAMDIARENALWRYEMYLRCVLAEIFRLTDRSGEALLMFEEAMPIVASLGIKGWLGHIHLALGNCNADLRNRSTAVEHYVKAREIYDDIGQKWGAINLEVAYQRFLAIDASVVDKDELSRLRMEADKLDYNVLSEAIDKLIAGNLEPIRFEYL